MNGRTLNLRLAKIAIGLALSTDEPSVRDPSGGFLDEAVRPDASPEVYNVYIYGVLTAWYLLALVAGLGMIGLGFIGWEIAGQPGRTTGAVVGAALAVFCIAGAADATWRSLFVYAAARRCRRIGGLDRRVRIEMRIARVQYPTLLVQGVVAVVAAIVAATLL